jgi:hypothetical protein
VLLPGLNIQAIPPQRKVRNDTELQQFLLADREAFIKSAHIWVRQTATRALDEALRAGNPKDYVVGIDGETRGANIRTGFRGGSIEQATQSVRIEFVGGALADVANGLRPILADVIRETFPNSRTKALQTQWSWWIQRGRYAGGSKSTTSVRLGSSVPDSVTIYDVLWLAPDLGPAKYAWFANHNAIKSGGSNYNLIKRKGGQFRLRKRLRGYLAESTRRMRGRKVPGVTIQGWIVKKAMTGPGAVSRYGVPVIRVAFKSGLTRAVIN